MNTPAWAVGLLRMKEVLNDFADIYVKLPVEAQLGKSGTVVPVPVRLLRDAYLVVKGTRRPGSCPRIPI